jgi:hypothetical protein
VQRGNFLNPFICEECPKHFWVFFKFSGLRLEIRSLFAKREAKMLIRILRILIQSAEKTISAGGAVAPPPQILILHTNDPP